MPIIHYLCTVTGKQCYHSGTLTLSCCELSECALVLGHVPRANCMTVTSERERMGECVREREYEGGRERERERTGSSWGLGTMEA